MKKSSFFLILFLSLFAFIADHARADFYVIAVGKRAKRTILVSPKATDTEGGTALFNALDGITDATQDNPYLILIEPGIYDLGSSSLQMKSYVDIQGSGENVTTIKGNIDSESSGVVNTAGYAEVRFLTVQNSGEGTCKIAIYTDSSSTKITNVTARAVGGTNNYGIYNYQVSFATMTNVTVDVSLADHNYGVCNDASHSDMTNVVVRASGLSGTASYGVLNKNGASPTMLNVCADASQGTYTYGVFNQGSSPKMRNVIASASGGTHNNGVYNELSSSASMTNLNATASGGNNSYGVRNGNSSCTMANSTVQASGGTNNYGVYNKNDSTGKIDHSTISGQIYHDGGTLYLGCTKVADGVNNYGGTIVCFQVYDGNYNSYTCP